MIKHIFDRRLSWFLPTVFLLVFNSLVYTFFKLNDQTFTTRTSKIILLINFVAVLYLSVSYAYKNRRISELKVSQPLSIALIILAWALRIALSRLGYNYDIESFEIVANHILDGHNFYNETSRYNYGPIWAYICAGLKYLSSLGGGYNPLVFHSYIVSVLFLFELLLLRTLKSTGFSNLALIIALFNPVSIILIGHHSQFDILALYFGFISMNELKNKKVFQASLWLGLSLSIKHLLAFFPLFLLFRNDFNLKEKLQYLFIPIIVFALGFLPFIEAWSAIKTNVIGYQLNHGQTLIYKIGETAIPNFLSDFGPINQLPFCSSYKPLWIGLILGTAYLMRQRQLIELLLSYLLVLLAFSPAISEQYFLIALPAVLYLRKEIVAWLYLAACSYYLMFVSYHNTGKYFNLTHLGLNLDYAYRSIGFAQIQLLLMLMAVRLVFGKRLEQPF